MKPLVHEKCFPQERHNELHLSIFVLDLTIDSRDSFLNDISLVFLGEDQNRHLIFSKSVICQ